MSLCYKAEKTSKVAIHLGESTASRVKIKPKMTVFPDQL